MAIKQWGDTPTPAGNLTTASFPIAYSIWYKVFITSSLTTGDADFNQSISYLNNYTNSLFGCAFRTSGYDKPAGMYLAIGL